MTGRSTSQWSHAALQAKVELYILGWPLGFRSQRKVSQCFGVLGLCVFKCSRDMKSFQVLFTPLDPSIWLQHFRCLSYDRHWIILCHDAKEKSNMDNVFQSLVDFYSCAGKIETSPYWPTRSSGISSKMSSLRIDTFLGSQGSGGHWERSTSKPSSWTEPGRE